MGNLDNTSKKSVFQVPDGYFEKLAAQIQMKVTDSRRFSENRPMWRYGFQYALPLLIVAVILLYAFPPRPDAESILSSVETADLVLYLQEDAGFTTEDLIENIEFIPADVEAIENEVYDPLGDTRPGDAEVELELNTL